MKNCQENFVIPIKFQQHFHETRMRNSKVSIEPQNTSNSQNNLERTKLEESGSMISNYVSNLKYLIDASVGKESACTVGDPGSIPGWGRFPGEGNGNPLQYSCLENFMDGRVS